MGGEKETTASGTLIRMYNVKDHYRIMDKVGKGTYGTVFKARATKDGTVCAIKKLENNDTKLQQEGFPITALRGTAVMVQKLLCLSRFNTLISYNSRKSSSHDPTNATSSAAPPSSSSNTWSTTSPDSSTAVSASPCPR